MIYPFTPKGVQDMLMALYALPDSELQVEANAIKNDFRLWVKNHFSLTTDQKRYLDSMPNQSTQYFGDQCWFCFLYRLNINLVYPAPPAPTGLGKWAESTSSATCTTNDDGGVEATGELTFTMIYREING